MPRVIAICVLLAALLPKHAVAHLGDTVSQVNAQYGHPLYEYAGQQHGEVVAKHKWKAYFVYVTYFRDKSEDETYIHQASDAPFAPSELQSLLRAASLGMRWQKAKTVPMWLLTAHDGKTPLAIAGYTSKLPDLGWPCFGVSTIPYARRHKIPGI